MTDPELEVWAEELLALTEAEERREASRFDKLRDMLAKLPDSMQISRNPRDLLERYR